MRLNMHMDFEVGFDRLLGIKKPMISDHRQYVEKPVVFGTENELRYVLSSLLFRCNEREQPVRLPNY